MLLDAAAAAGLDSGESPAVSVGGRLSPAGVLPPDTASVLCGDAEPAPASGGAVEVDSEEGMDSG